MQPDESLIGRQLQQYHVTALLGRGGMGVVYRARDVRLERDVALKVLAPGELQDDTRRQRFLREARAASALSHANIVTVYEIDSAEGLDFIAMEVVEGKPLSACIPKDGLPLSVAANYSLQMLEGVSAAHRAGLVHRDLKPGNLMIRTDGVLKVLDFGLAKRQSTVDGETASMVTEEGRVVGTITYMSPEQARGEEVGPPSDVFVMGTIVYEMLTGRKPFRGAGLGVLHALIEGKFDTVQKVRPECPPAFDRVIAKALVPEPRLRYTDAGAMLEDFRREGIVPASSSSTSSEAIDTMWRAAAAARPQSWLRGRKFLGAAAAVFAVALSAAVWRWVPHASSDPETLTAIEGASAPELCRRATELLRLYYREGYVDRAIEQLGAALRQKENYPLAEARLSLAYWRKNSLSPDPHWQQQATAYADRAVAADSQLAVAHIAKGASLAATGQLEKAAASFQSAYTLDPAHCELSWRLGDLSMAQKDPKGAEQHYLRAVATGPKEWESYGKLGGFYYRQSRYQEALKAFERMRDLAPDHTRAYSNLAAVYHQLDRTDEAAAALQRSLEIAPNAATYSNLGTLLYFQGRYPEAASAFERAVQLGANNYLHWGNLADAVRLTPESRAKAAESYTRAIQLARERLATYPDDADARSSLALYLARNGQPQPALAELNRTLQQKSPAPSVLFKLAVVHELAGRRAAALALLRRSLEAKYPLREISREPDLVKLRTDPEYHKLAAQFQ